MIRIPFLPPQAKRFLIMDDGISTVHTSMILLRSGLSKGSDGKVLDKDAYYMLSMNSESHELYDKRFSRKNGNLTGNARLDFIPNTRRSISLWMDVYASSDAEKETMMTRVRLYYEPITPNFEWKIRAAENMESTLWRPLQVNINLANVIEPDASNIIFMRTLATNTHILDKIPGNPLHTTPKDIELHAKFVMDLNHKRMQKQLDKAKVTPPLGAHDSGVGQCEEEDEEEIEDEEEYDESNTSTSIREEKKSRKRKMSDDFSPRATSTQINLPKRKKTENYGFFSTPDVWIETKTPKKNTELEKVSASKNTTTVGNKEDWRNWLYPQK